MILQYLIATTLLVSLLNVFWLAVLNIEVSKHLREYRKIIKDFDYVLYEIYLKEKVLYDTTIVS